MGRHRPGTVDVTRRMPESFVHGLDLDGQGVVVVPAKVCDWIARAVDSRAVSVRDLDPDVHAVLVAICFLATRYRARYRAEAESCTPGEAPSESKSGLRVSVTEAARDLGISDRAVRAAIAEGRLVAERDGSRWRVHRASIENYPTRDG